MYFQLKERFLRFFQERGHKIVASSSLLPKNDPSVLLTTAGMQQFKEYFTLKKDPLKDFGTQRVASCQKCFRTTDIEEVGDERHLTFFEMLGNFSFGPIGSDDPDDFSGSGYFKKSAIKWALDFLVKELNLKIDYVTFFVGQDNIPQDQESYKILKELGFQESHLKGCSKEDNFWGPTGKEGPCGPTVEFYIDGIEVWNLVFNEYYCFPDGTLERLQSPGVDTGMGYERLLKVFEKKETIFQTSAFESIFKVLKPLIPQENQGNIKDQRILADHLRGIVFLIADGLLPSNVGAGYVLRRIIRRFLFKFKKLNLPAKSDKILIQKVIEFYKLSYPEIDNFEKIYEVFEEEKEKFEAILERGIKIFEKEKERIIQDKAKGAFLLFSTYGFPLELTKELLKEEKILWAEEDQIRFEELFQEHRQISKHEEENNF